MLLISHQNARLCEEWQDARLEERADDIEERRSKRRSECVLLLRESLSTHRMVGLLQD